MRPGARTAADGGAYALDIGLRATRLDLGRGPSGPADPPLSRPGSGATGWIPSFVALSAIWGASFLFIKVADDDGWAPLLVALVRLAVGSAVLLAVLVARRGRLPRGARLWGHLAVAGALFNALPFSLFAFSETGISSVLAGIWNATTPLNTLLVALVVLPDERPTRARLAGLAAGFAAVVLVLGPWRGLGGRSLLGNLAGFGAAACYGLGFPYTRRYLAGRSESGVSLSAAQMLCATAQLALVAPWLVTGPSAWRAQSVLSLLALGALGTGIAYILSYRVIRAAGATVASTVTYLIPLFSTVLGVAVLGERLTWNQPVGAVVVLLGVAVSQGVLRARRAPEAPVPG